MVYLLVGTKLMQTAQQSDSVVLFFEKSLTKPDRYVIICTEVIIYAVHYMAGFDSSWKFARNVGYSRMYDLF